jgi:hypothetical protein
MLTMDAIRMMSRVQGAAGIPLARPVPLYNADGTPMKTRDGAIRTADSTGAFLVGELERLDQALHMPLVAFTYGRDLLHRSDVTDGDEVSSFTVSSFGAVGGLGTGNGIGNGKAWAGKESTQITNVSVDIAKIAQPLGIWAHEVKWSIPELVSAAQAGRPIDQQKIEGLKLKRDMDFDEQAYYGDNGTGATGLLTLDRRTDQAKVTTVQPVAQGASGSTNWLKKNPDEILTDFNNALTTVWTASAYAVMPTKILLPPIQYGYIATAKIGDAAQTSILQYILDNNLAKKNANIQLTVEPVKWAVGAGVGGTIGTPSIDRMAVYTNEMERVRFPFTLLKQTPVQYDGLYHKITFWCRLGQVEPVYPETIGYFDGL